MNDEQNNFFAFEADFVESLHCIPMCVRMKLDTCGVKLKLSHWNQFDEVKKQAAIAKPCNTLEEAEKYKNFLQDLVTEKTGAKASLLAIEDNPAWLNNAVVPSDVVEKAAEINLTITTQQWANLTPLQRFALIKLSRPSHENSNFLPALKEFGLV
jgi:hypothetical protein